MAMLKSLMINTFRDSDESDTVWTLRRAFLDRNIQTTSSTELKDHMIMLSRCFIKMVLYKSQEFPYYIIQEVLQHSGGLTDDINKAQSNFNPNESVGNGNMGTPQDFNALSVIPTKKKQPQNHNKKAMKRKNKKELFKFVIKKQPKLILSQSINFVSGDTYHPSKSTPQPAPASTQSSSSSKSESESSIRFQASHSRHVNNKQESVRSARHGAEVSAMDRMKRADAEPMTKKQAKAERRLSQPSPIVPVTEIRKFGSEAVCCMTVNRLSNTQPRLIRKDVPPGKDASICSERSLQNPHQETSGDLSTLPAKKSSHDNIPPKTYNSSHYDKSTTQIGIRQYELNSSQKSTLEVEEQKSSQEQKNAQDNTQQKQSLHLQASQEQKSSREQKTSQKQKILQEQVVQKPPHGQKAPQQDQKTLQVQKAPQVKKAPGEQDSSTEQGSSLNQSNSSEQRIISQEPKAPSQEKTTLESKKASQVGQKPDDNDDDNSKVAQINQSKDAVLDNAVGDRLETVLKVARCYARFKDNSTISPFLMLKKCAVTAVQKLKLVSKKISNSDGSKAFVCQVFITDILLDSIHVPLDMSPDTARNQLATKTLARISHPYLRLTNNGGGKTFELEASDRPFPGGAMEPNNAPQDKAVDNGQDETSHSQDENRDDRKTVSNKVKKDIETSFVAATSKNNSEDDLLAAFTSEDGNKDYQKPVPNTVKKDIQTSVADAASKNKKKQDVTSLIAAFTSEDKNEDYQRSVRNKVKKDSETSVKPATATSKNVQETLPKAVVKQKTETLESATSKDISGDDIQKLATCPRDLEQNRVSKSSPASASEIACDYQMDELAKLTAAMKSNADGKIVERLKNEVLMPKTDGSKPFRNRYTSFDSYLACMTETDPRLKKIRQLAHMYVTLPVVQPDPSVTVKFLSKSSDIKLDLYVDDSVSHTTALIYSVVMDDELVLVSCSAPTEEAGVRHACQQVLLKIVRPYLCLKGYMLEASLHPFPLLSAEECLAQGILYDNWESACQNFPSPIPKAPFRKPRFFLIRGQCGKYHSMFTRTTRLLSSDKGKELNRSISYVYTKLTNPNRTQCTLFMDKQLIGTGIATGKSNSREKACKQAFLLLRKCHWLMFEESVEKQRNNLTLDDLVPYLPPSILPPQTPTPTAIGSGNMGHRLLTKMGWSGGGIGKDETGRTEPVAVEMLKKKAGLGFQNPQATNSSNSRVDFSKLGVETILRAYKRMPSQTILHLPPIVYNKEIEKIKHLSSTLQMKVRLRGKNNNRRVVVRKEFHAFNHFSDILLIGGQAENNSIIPPDIYDLDKMPENTELEFIQNKQTQCSLIEAPPLRKMAAGGRVEITFDLEGDSEDDEMDDDNVDDEKMSDESDDDCK